MITNTCLTGGSPLCDAPDEPLPDPPSPPPAPLGRLGPWPAGDLAPLAGTGALRGARARVAAGSGVGVACASGGSPPGGEADADGEVVDVGAAAVAERSWLGSTIFIGWRDAASVSFT